MNTGGLGAMAADAKGLVVHLLVPKGISLVWM